MASPLRKARLGELLIAAGEITPEQLENALVEQKRSGRKLGAILIHLGMTTEERILKALAQQLNLPIIDLKRYPLDPNVAKKLPENLARRHRALLLAEGPPPLIALADPTNLFAYDEIAQALRAQPDVALTREEDLLFALDTVYRQTDKIARIAKDLGEALAETETDLNQLLRAEDLSDAPVVKLLQSLFEEAAVTRASDIHIEPDEKVLRLRLRIDGALHEQIVEEKRIAPAVVSRVKLMSGLDISERRLPQDGRFAITVRNRRFDVRVSTMPTQYGESVVMRLLENDLSRFDLEKLGMPPKILTRFRQQVARPHGIVLVTGPTGSGKTTTLYAALKELNTPQRKIITAEDPVEYRLERINQVQVKPEIGLTFAEILRTALRQDPDVILVGEIRDSETVEIALRAAITGHMVLSTLHTNDAPSAVERLIDMGAPPFLLAAAIRAVIAQRLVRRICPDCIEPDPLDDATRNWLAAQSLPSGAFTPMRGRGCARCNMTGYRGRIGVYEYFEPSYAQLDALRRNDLATFNRLVREAPDYHTLLDHGLTLVAQGVTTVAEVIAMSGELIE